MDGSVSARRARSLALAMYVPGLVYHCETFAGPWLTRSLLKLLYSSYLYFRQSFRYFYHCQRNGVVC